MFARSPWQAWLLALICVALLWTRAGGAHLHLCFDGKEAPATLHMTHGALHDESHDAHHDAHHGADEVHSDLDLPLGDQPLTKPGKSLQDLPLFLLATLFLLFLSTSRDRFVPRTAPPDRSSASQRLRPPLRGPPRAFSRP